MISRISQISTIAAKEINYALLAHLLTLLTGFLVAASLVSLSVSAVALHGEYLIYIESRDLLISLGKPVLNFWSAVAANISICWYK